MEQMVSDENAERAYQAVKAAPGHAREGATWVVDLDITQFFDPVNHDILMHRMEQTIRDKRVLGLTGRYLRAGVFSEGLVVATEEGTPQGGPLSPLLANLYLDALDKELEKRGHRFSRYADDGNIYVQSETAAQRVLESVAGWIRQNLKLAEDRQAVLRWEGWIRRHIRCCFWQRWHGSKGRYRRLRELGLSERQCEVARSSKGAWVVAATQSLQTALSNRRLSEYGFLMPSEAFA